MEWPSFKRKQRNVETKSAVLGLDNATGKFLVFGATTATTAASAINLYEQSTAVSIPVNIVADAFSVLKPVLVMGDKMVREHEVLDFVKNPSPYYSGELFLEVLAKDYLITGEALVVGLGNPDRAPLELQPLSPQVLTAAQGQDGLVDSFFVGGTTLTGTYRPKLDKGTVRYFDTANAFRELKQIRNFSTKRNSLLRGQSPLVSAAREARSHVLGTAHNVSLLEKGGRVSLIFHFKEDMSTEDFDAAKEKVLAQYGGATQAGMIGVTAGPELDINEIGINNKDMDWGLMQKVVAKALALQYHVPLPLISDERQTMSNYREGKLALYDDAVIPLSRRIFGGLADFLLPRFGIDPRKASISFDPDEVTALVSRRNDELKKRREIAVESDNEMRALMAREPYEGGDVVYKAANMIPVGSDLFTEDNDDELTPE